MPQPATKPAIQGLIAPVLTPFNDDLSVAEDLFIAHCQWLLTPDGGCAGLAPFGTTSEALSIGVHERKAVLEKLVAAGVEAAKLLPGVGLTNAYDTADLIRHATGLGCHGVMILPPFYFKDVSEDGLYAYFAQVLGLVDNSKTKYYLYHIPQVAGVGLPVTLVKRLAKDFPAQIIGIKDSSGDWDNTAALLDIKNFSVYPGSEMPLIEAMAKGAPGCISATANINGKAIAEVIALCQAGDTAGATEKHKAVQALRELFHDYAPIQAQKAMLARWRGDARWGNLRPPLMAIDGKKADALQATLKNEFGVGG